MGLGKTLMVERTLDLLKLAGSNFFPVLIIAPKRVADIVWTAERDKWSCLQDLTITKILGDKGRRLEALKAPKTDIYVINYENLPWLCSQLRGKWPFKIVVADESTRLKNFRLINGGVRAAALSKVATQTGRWINLTGTPCPNGLTDLWGQVWFLDFGARLGRTYTSFLHRWFHVNEYTHETTAAPGAEEEIHAALKDIMLVLRAEDWLDVKKPLETQVEVELPDDARKLYDRMEDEFFAEIGTTEIEAFNAAAKSMKLIQLTSGSIYDNLGIEHPVHDAKIEALEDVAEECGEPLLVVYHWKFDADRIKRKFPKARVFDKPKDADDWNAGRIPMLLVHPQSAGHGINLQDGGRDICFFTNTYNLELRQQVIERLGPTRQIQSGHNRVVRIWDIVARNTKDCDVLDVLQGKCTIQDALKRAHARR